MKELKIKDVMTESPFMVRPMQMVTEAAKLMKDLDCGVLPVGTPENVIGMITDRDIVLRVIAEGMHPTRTPVEAAMTHKVYSCKEDDDLEDAAEEMRKHDVSRLVVMKGRKAVGIVTLACLLRNCGDRAQSNKVLHELLGPQKHRKFEAEEMGMAGAGCESCDAA